MNHAEHKVGTQPLGGHGGHGWMMIACCIPMLLIACALVLAGVVSAGFLVVAAACTEMVAVTARIDDEEVPAGNQRRKHWQYWLSV
jgi:hypothetical protein